MKGYKYKEIMAPGFKMPSDREGLEAVYRTLAKTADQRMVRLEKLASEGGKFANVTKWAYSRASRDIRGWTDYLEKPRWNTKAPRTIGGLESKIEDIKTFLSSRTSTKKGVLDYYISRTNKINEEYGTDFTWEDIGKYFDSELNENLDKKYGSKTKMRAIAQIRKNKDKIIDKIENAKKTRIIVPDKMVQSTVNNIIKDYQKEVFDYLRK